MDYFDIINKDTTLVIISKIIDIKDFITFLDYVKRFNINTKDYMLLIRFKYDKLYDLILNTHVNDVFKSYIQTHYLDSVGYMLLLKITYPEFHNIILKYTKDRDDDTYQKLYTCLVSQDIKDFNIEFSNKLKKCRQLSIIRKPAEVTKLLLHVAYDTLLKDKYLRDARSDVANYLIDVKRAIKSHMQTNSLYEFVLYLYNELISSKGEEEVNDDNDDDDDDDDDMIINLYG
jgi:hypothetical protein